MARVPIFEPERLYQERLKLSVRRRTWKERKGRNIACKTAVFSTVDRFLRTSLNLRGTPCLAMVPNRRRQACLGSFLSQRFALKRPAIRKAFARNGTYRAGEKKRTEVFAMSYTMKVSAFLYLLIMCIIAVGLSGMQFPH